MFETTEKFRHLSENVPAFCGIEIYTVSRIFHGIIPENALCLIAEPVRSVGNSLKTCFSFQ